MNHLAWLHWLGLGSELLGAISRISMAITVLVLLRRIKVPFQGLGLAFITSVLARVAYNLLDLRGYWDVHIQLDPWARLIVALAAAVTAVLWIKALPGMMRVVTAARASETRQAALVEKTEMNERLLKTCPDPIFAFDRDVRFTWWNPAMEKFTGVLAQDAIGRVAAELFPDIRARGIEQLYLRTLNGESINIDQREFISRVTGKKGWYHAQWRPLHSPANEVIGGLCFVRDVTEWTERESLLKEQQMQLVESAKLKALGEMAGGMAHEINTPVSTIVLKANELRKLSPALGPHESAVSASAGKIHKTAMRIGEIIQSLKIFARDSTHDPFVSVEIENVLHETLNLCEARFRKNKIELRVEHNVKELKIDCRPVQIVQVLINLLNNSFDAVMTRDDRQVQIAVTDHPTMVQLEIQDNGPGIPEEMLPRLMQPFATTKGVGQGTGLGLSISKGIVESHGGMLTHESPGGRTSFSVWLPKHQS